VLFGFEYDVVMQTGLMGRRPGAVPPRWNDERALFLHGLSISPEFQRKMSQLNCAAWLTEDRALDDRWDAAKRLLTRRNRKLVCDVPCLFFSPGVDTPRLA
jgi:hypothetical protein